MLTSTAAAMQSGVMVIFVTFVIDKSLQIQGLTSVAPFVIIYSYHRASGLAHRVPRCIYSLMI
ncbi:hypothetical protein CPT_Muenster_018 [Klebsiella phage Muenster]|nr:hypothetical protein CPT_Muenster_018 [Klebsiella phage Muenster]